MEAAAAPVVCWLVGVRRAEAVGFIDLDEKARSLLGTGLDAPEPGGFTGAERTAEAVAVAVEEVLVVEEKDAEGDGPKWGSDFILVGCCDTRVKEGFSPDESHAAGVALG